MGRSVGFLRDPDDGILLAGWLATVVKVHTHSLICSSTTTLLFLQKENEKRETSITILCQYFLSL